MRLTTQELKTHAENAYKFYQIDLGAPDNAYWLLSPGDYHVLVEVFQEEKKPSDAFPTLLKIPCVVAYIWRKPPIIFMNIRDVDFDLENGQSNAEL